MKLRKFAVIAAMGLCAAGSAWARTTRPARSRSTTCGCAPRRRASPMARATWRSTTRPRPPTACVGQFKRRRARRAAYRGNQDGVAKMRQVEGGIALPAGGEVKLAPGGYHVMFLKLKAPSPKACGARHAQVREGRRGRRPVQGQARRAQPRHESRPQLDEALSARRSAEQRKRDARSTERASLHLNDRELRATPAALADPPQFGKSSPTGATRSRLPVRSGA